MQSLDLGLHYCLLEMEGQSGEGPLSSDFLVEQYVRGCFGEASYQYLLLKNGVYRLTDPSSTGGHLVGWIE